MGMCLSKTETSEVSKRFLVNDSHFVAVTVATKTKVAAAKTTAAFEDAPLCVWISRGMPHERPELSELNKRIVLESWVYLRLNMFKIGHIIFTELFAMSPMLMNLFEKYDAVVIKDQDLGKGAAFSRRGRYYATKSHVDKVMITLDKILAVLDDTKRFEYLMHELGDRHAERNVRIEYLDLFIPCFIQAIRPALTERWASSIEDAWAAFLRHSLHYMKESIVF
ncbi:hypothetical protein ACOMHN_007712 [Nucella lapillus]